MVDTEGVNTNVTVNVDGAVSGFEQAGEACQTYSDDVQTASGEVSSATDDMVTSNDGLVESHGNVKSATQETTSSMKEGALGASEFAAGTTGLIFTLDAMDEAQTGVESANKKVEVANLANQKAQEAYNAAVAKFGPDSQQAKDALDKLNITQQQQQIAVERADEAQKSLSETQLMTAATVMPELISTIEGGTKAIGAMSDLVGKGPEVWGALSAAFGVSTAAEGTEEVANEGLTVSFMGLNVGMGLILIAVIAIAAAAYLIYTNWGTVQAFFEGLWNGIVSACTQAYNIIKPVIDGIATVFNTVFGVIQSVVTTVLGIIGGAINLYFTIWIAVITTALNVIVGVFTFAWNLIQVIVGVAMLVIQKVIEPAMNAIYQIIKPVLDAIYSVFQTVWGGIQSAVSFVLAIIGGAIELYFGIWKAVITTTLDIILEIVSEVWNGIQFIFQTAMNIITPIVNGAFSLIHQYIVPPMQTIYNIVSGILNDIKSIFTSVFNSLSGIVQGAINAVMSAFAPLTNAAGKVGDALGKVGSGDIVGAVQDIGSIIGLAEGGMVKATPGGVIVRVGEGGEDEYVVPKSKMVGIFQGASPPATTVSAPVGVQGPSTSSSSSSVSIGQVNITGGNGQSMVKQFVDALKQQNIRVVTG